MKHNFNTTVVILILFLLSQLVGIVIISNYINFEDTNLSGTLTYYKLPLNLEAPELNYDYSFVWIFLAIIVGTILLLFIMKSGFIMLWKLWFWFAMLFILTVSFGAFINYNVALLLALIISSWKIFKPNIIVHNLAEIFMYGGLAIIFVQVLDLFGVFILLILISIYDYLAVFKSKHMIDMAKFQNKAKIFSGLIVPNKNKLFSLDLVERNKVVKSNVKTKSAILGGGDMGFPLIFIGVVIKSLAQLGFSKLVVLLYSLIIVFTTTLSLFGLLYYSKKNKFYPAMPIISVGLIVGYLIVKLIIY